MFPISVSLSNPLVISVTILTAIGAYVLFGPDPNERRRRGYPAGLINYGNNCFANAIVQCLAASSIFIRWLEEQQKKNPLAPILLQLISSINGQADGSTSDATVASLIEHMRQPRWLTPFEQQDSHEFLLSLLNSLTSLSTPRKKPIGFSASLQSDEEELHLITESPLTSPHPFQGLQVTQLQCTKCKHKVKTFLHSQPSIDRSFDFQNPISVSLFETLSLTIPERQVANTGVRIGAMDQKRDDLFH